MLSASLRSIYQSYKLDTDLVATWLAETAKANGYKGGPSKPGAAAAPGPAPKEPSARLKGKARKQAKAAQAATASIPQQTTKPKPSTQYNMAMSDFVPMAEHIANLTNVAVKVPEWFSVALERVIWVRSSFAEQLTEAGVRVDRKSDKRHTFFVSVLEKVRKSLSPLISTEAFNVSHLKDATAGIEAGGPRGTTSLKNLFEVLDVYEPSEAFLNAPDLEVPKPAEPAYKAEVEEDSLFEAIFAMTTLMGDLSRLRSEIADLWSSYSARQTDLAAVALATNTAMELARNYQDEIAPIIRSNGGFTKFHSEYFYAVCNATGLDAESRQRHNDDYNFQVYDIADSLFVNTFINLISFVRANANKHNQVTAYNGMFGWYDETPMVTPLTSRQKYLQNKAALLELLPDLKILSGTGTELGPVEDQLIRGFRDVWRLNRQMRDEDPEVPVWFSFATQVYLDTLKNVQIGNGWKDLQAAVATVEASVINLSTSCTQRRKLLKDVEYWTRDDPLAVIYGAINGDPHHKPYKFFRRSPLHCGLCVHYLRNLFHRAGVEYAAVPGAVMTMTQLYHALRQEKYLEVAWKDLETLQNMQGKSTYFIGDPPTSFEAYQKNYCLTLGMSTTNWVPNQRQKQQVKTSKATVRDMKFMGVTSAQFIRRIMRGGDERTITPEVVAEWIEKGREGRSHTESAASEQSVKHKSLLHELAAAIQAEVPGIMFDYFTMHNLCWDLLRRLRLELDKVTDGYCVRTIKNDDHLPFLVGFVFAKAVGQLMPSEKKHVPSEVLFKVASETAGKWLEQGMGSHVSDAGGEAGEKARLRTTIPPL